MEHSVFLSLTRLNFQQNYVKSTYFYLRISQSKLFSRNIFQVKEAQHIVKITENSLSQSFGKNFVKVTILLKKLQNR